MRKMKPGFYPFWFWNGDLDEDEIRRQIAEMADKGVRGFYIHSRQGLRQPYLSESFFRMVEVAVEAAAAHGLTAELYDEYPYPSGAAGGQVALGRPEHMATRLLQETFDVPGGPVRRSLPVGEVLCCKAYPLHQGQVKWDLGIDLLSHVGTVLREDSYREVGLTPYNRKRYFASSPTPTLVTDDLTGPHRVFVSVQAVVTGHKYWDHFADVMRPETVERFLALTHQRYAARLGRHFGETIGSFFVDETAPRWSGALPAYFREQYGYDLLPLLPALQDPTHPEHLRVSADLFHAQYRLFCESFELPIAAWCREHGLRYAGEKTSVRLAQLRYMDIPGCDPGHTKAGAPLDMFEHVIRHNARAVASAAYLYGKEGALCECYHSMGWSATLQDARIVAEGLLLAGIRYLVPHGFFYTTHGLRKHDAPPSFFFQLPAWKHFGALSARLERIAEAFEGTHIDTRVLLIDPHGGLPTEAQLETYQQLIDQLLGAHVDFLVADTDMLEDGDISDGRLHLRDVTIETVLVPPMRVVEEPLERWLQRFAAAGGTVLRITDNTANAVATVRRQCRPSLELTCLGGDAQRVYMVTRTDGRHRTYLLLNTAGDRCDLRLHGPGALREIDLDGLGEARPCPQEPAWRLAAEKGGWRRTLAPFESALLTDDTAAAPAAEGAPGELPSVTLRLPLEVEVRPLQPNLLRMGTWMLSLGNRPEHEAPVPAVPVATQLSIGGHAFAPRYQPGGGVMPTWHQPDLDLRYRFAFFSSYGGAVELVMEPGSISGDWRIFVNGQGPITSDSFEPTASHIRGSLGVDVSRWLMAGANEFVVQVRTDRRDGGLLNPLYLAGHFAVELDPLTLVSRTATGRLEAWEENGLPFYAGTVEYEGAVVLDSVPGSGDVRVELDFPCAFEDAAELALNEGPWQPAIWSPYAVRVPATQLKKGQNRVRLRVHTSLVRAFDGLRWNVAEHRYEPVDPGAA